MRWLQVAVLLVLLAVHQSPAQDAPLPWANKVLQISHMP